MSIISELTINLDKNCSFFFKKIHNKHCKISNLGFVSKITEKTIHLQIQRPLQKPWLFFFFSIITQVLEQAIQLNFASINLQISEKN